MPSEHRPIVSLRIADDEDLDRLVLWDEEAAIASTGSGFSEQGRMRTRGIYAEAIHDPKKEVLIATSEGKGIGSAFIEHDRKAEGIIDVVGGSFPDAMTTAAVPTVEKFLSIFRNEVPGLKRAYIKSLAIDAGSRGKGMGRRFMDAILDHLRGKGVEVLTFATGKDNAAMRGLFKRAIFLEVRSSHGGYTDTKLLGMLDLRRRDR